MIENVATCVCILRKAYAGKLTYQSLALKIKRSGMRNALGSVEEPNLVQHSVRSAKQGPHVA